MLAGEAVTGKMKGRKPAGQVGQKGPGRGRVHRVAVLPTLSIPAQPIWLTVHREVRSKGRIQAVFDFLAQAVPQALAPDALVKI